MHNQQQQKDETEIKFFIIENVTVILSLDKKMRMPEVFFQITFHRISLIFLAVTWAVKQIDAR